MLPKVDSGLNTSYQSPPKRERRKSLDLTSTENMQRGPILGAKVDTGLISNEDLNEMAKKQGAGGSP